MRSINLQCAGIPLESTHESDEAFAVYEIATRISSEELGSAEHRLYLLAQTLERYLSTYLSGLLCPRLPVGNRLAPQEPLEKVEQMNLQWQSVLVLK